MLFEWILTSLQRHFALFGLSVLLWNSYFTLQDNPAYYPFFGDQDDSSLEICKSDSCIRTAEHLRNLIDENEKPCENFFSFACGTFIKKYKPLLKPSTSVMSPLEFTIINMKNTIIEDLMREDVQAPEPAQKARKFFASCTNENELKHLKLLPLDILLKTVGLELKPAFIYDNSKQINPSVVIAKIRQQLDINFPFRLTVERDPKDKSKSRLEIKIPLPDINSKVSYSKKVETKETKENEDQAQEYQPLMNYIVKVALGMYAYTRDPSMFEADHEMTIRFEMAKIAYLIHRVEKLIKSINLRKLKGREFTISELQQLTDSFAIKENENRVIDWSLLIEQLFTYSSLEGQISNTDKIYVEDVNYLKKLITLMSYSSLKTLVGAMWWHTVRSHILDLHADMRILEENYRTEVGLRVLKRAEYCVDSTIDVFGYATVYSYMNNETINASFRKFFEKLPQNLFEVFEGIIKKSEWLKMNTIMGALQKLKSTYITLGYPAKFNDYAQLQAAYQHVILHENNYFITRFFYNFARIRQQFRAISGPIIQQFPHPLEKKIVFDYQNNEIFVPLALLHFPMLLDSSNSLLVGTLTFSIIHAMFHSFDAKGAEWNLWGVHSNWWSKKSASEYFKKTKCFVEFYEKQCFPEIHKCVDGEATVNETVAENGAFKAALEIFYRIRNNDGNDPKLVNFESYTSDQLLTLAYTVQLCQVQTYEKLIEELENSDSPPASVLVNGTLMNSAAFQEIWGCRDTNRMNVENKCVLW